MRFDRFDICEAYLALEWDYNTGGWLHERPSNARRLEATSVQLARIRFKSGASFNGYDSLTENGRAIYHALEVRYNFKERGDADLAWEKLLAEAAKIGAEHGEGTAAFQQQYLVGGRVTDGSERATATHILKGLEDGDPEVLDALPHPDLSGQWADGYTPNQLAEDCELDEWVKEFGEEADDCVDDLCTAYEEAFQDAAQEEVIRFCKAALGKRRKD